MVKIESLWMTEQYTAKLSWWVSSLSSAKVSGKTFPSDSSRRNRNILFLQRKELQQNLCHTTRPHRIGHSWIQAITVEISGSSEVKFSNKNIKLYRSLKIHHTCKYLYRSQRWWQTGNSSTHDGNNYNTYIYFTKGFLWSNLVFQLTAQASHTVTSSRMSSFLNWWLLKLPSLIGAKLQKQIPYCIKAIMLSSGIFQSPWGYPCKNP